MKTMSLSDDPHSPYPPEPERPDRVPGYCVLEGFAEFSSQAQSVDLKRLAPHDIIRLRTLNSEYQIVLLDPASQRATVQGGSYFGEPTEAIIRGSTCGGAMLKMGWIVVGLQLELVYHPEREQSQSLTTSPVELLRLEYAGL